MLRSSFPGPWSPGAGRHGEVPRAVKEAPSGQGRGGGGGEGMQGASTPEGSRQRRQPPAPTPLLQPQLCSIRDLQ